MANLITSYPRLDFSAGSEASQWWEAVEKIAGSDGFRRSPRLREFLFYVASQQLNGHPEEITEQIVGHRVYHRSENYNPTEDNIVRVSARQLRAKLREYYESDGLHDPWIVEIPKGAYIPQFRQRDQVSLQEAPAILPTAEPQAPVKRDFARWLAPLMAALVAATVTWFIARPSSSEKDGGSPNPAGSHDVGLVAALFASSSSPLRVIVSDSALSMMEVIAKRRFTLDEYANQGYRRPPPGIEADAQAMRMWSALDGRQFVNLGDLGAVNQFSKALTASGNTAGVFMSCAQNIRPRDFRSGNFVLLGSSSSDPWVQIFSADRFNYRFVNLPPADRLAIRDMHPKPGEPELYTQRNGSNEGYARIALVPNLTNTGKVLLIAGTSMESTEAASSFSLDARSLRTLLASLHMKDASQLSSFEALLRTREQSGTGVNAQLVSVRRLNQGQ